MLPLSRRARPRHRSWTHSWRLVKSHFPEADLELVGDGIAPDTSDDDWSVCLSSVGPIAERAEADLNL